MNRTHPLRTTPLVIGIIFLGIAGMWLARQLGWLTATDTRFVAPVVLILAGVIGVLAFIFRSPLNNEGETHEQPTHAPTDPLS